MFHHSAVGRCVVFGIQVIAHDIIHFVGVTVFIGIFPGGCLEFVAGLRVFFDRFLPFGEFVCIGAGDGQVERVHFMNDPGRIFLVNVADQNGETQVFVENINHFGQAKQGSEGLLRRRRVPGHQFLESHLRRAVQFIDLDQGIHLAVGHIEGFPAFVFR